MKRIALPILAVVGLVAITATPILLPTLVAQPTSERITNGSFEEGFRPDGVAYGWEKFDNGGGANYGWYPETWAPTIYDGKYAQLIEINTFLKDRAAEPDRYAGIYQTVSVVPGAKYRLTFRGMIRTTEADVIASGYGYQFQFGIDYDGGTDWRKVDNWTGTCWNIEYPRLAPGEIKTYTTEIVAKTNRLTIFFRAWKKWATYNREFDLDIDGVSLVGPTPAPAATLSPSLEVPSLPQVGRTYPIRVAVTNSDITEVKVYENGSLIGSAAHAVGALSMAREFAWTPLVAGNRTIRLEARSKGGIVATLEKMVKVYAGKEYVQNGDFEAGFTNGVAVGWTPFHNGGRANFVFYDETWAPTIWNGQHAQGLEINSFLKDSSTDPDRYIGIYQVLKGLVPGARYTLTIHGMLRTTEADVIASGYGYQLQWAIDPKGGTDWRAIPPEQWTGVCWNKEYPRLAPGPVLTYVTEITAPSDTITLFIRGWKKWATLHREFDLTVDGVSLFGP